MFAGDAATFLADYGDAVVWSSNPSSVKPTGLMIFDQPDGEIVSGEIISREYLVTFETTAWAGLKRDERLTIAGSGGGLTYKLRTDPHRLDDGVFSTAKVTRVLS